MSIDQSKTHSAALAHEHLARARPAVALGAAGLFVSSLFLGACGSDDTSSGGGTGTGGSGAAGGNGGGGGTPAECVPSEAQGSVADSCGVFVAPSGNDDTGLGTKISPYATIGKGLHQADGKPIYLCADAFTETVVITEGVDIFGGLDCAAGWGWVGQTTKTALTSTAGAIPLSVTAAGSGSHITDLAITAAPGTPASGESSVAALVDQAQVLFERCDLTAQAGADGAIGDTPPGRGQDGVVGPDGTDGCTATGSVFPAPPVTVTCDVGGTSGGGQGGIGNSGSNGGPGADGESNPAVAVPAINGGPGQTTSAQASAGTAGQPGAPGDPGLGAVGVGTIGTNGYAGVAGDPGQTAGSPGQGGGGGGGARGSMACTTTTYAGPAGGGGGTGGCGGLPGSGGGAGGSSIALISINVTVTLTACSVTAANGGTGGQGSPGQEGGNGLGGGGTGAGNNYQSGGGGGGGKGGQGGAAGGGHGGHSLGIAFDGGAAPVLTDTTFSVGTAGAGGPGGVSPALDGEAGLPCQTLDFAQGAAGCVNG